MSDGAPGEGVRVLVVDDDPMARLVLRASLERLGYGVEEAEGADQALAAVRARAPAAVLVDLHMPKVDGIALCRALRGEPIRLDAPILMVTGEEEGAFLGPAFDAGADDILPKPPPMPILRARLSHLLELYARRRAARAGE